MWLQRRKRLLIIQMWLCQGNLLVTNFQRFYCIYVFSNVKWHHLKGHLIKPLCLANSTEKNPGGEIKSAYCSCTAGLLACWNHVVAMFFRIAIAVSMGILLNPAVLVFQTFLLFGSFFRPGNGISLEDK